MIEDSLWGKRVDFLFRKQVGQFVIFQQLAIGAVERQDSSIAAVVPVIERDQVSAVGDKEVNRRDRIQQVDRLLQSITLVGLLAKEIGAGVFNLLCNGEAR